MTGRALHRGRPPRAHAARRRRRGRSRRSREAAPSISSGCWSPGGPAAPGCSISPTRRRWCSELATFQAPSSPMSGSASSPPRPISSPASCASRCASTCARGRASRPRCTDEHALNVTYRYDRGEPRGSLKKAAQLREQGCRRRLHRLPCNASQVCPTGIDIRNGAQLDCIQCGLCIDACDEVMAQDRPADAADRLRHRPQHQAPPARTSRRSMRVVRPRTMLYAALIAVVGGVMLVRAGDAHGAGHQRDPRPQSDVRAALRRRDPQRLYDAHPQQARRAAQFALSVDWPRRLAARRRRQTRADGRSVVEVGPDQTREVRVLVTDYARLAAGASTPITFTSRREHRRAARRADRLLPRAAQEECHACAAERRTAAAADRPHRVALSGRVLRRRRRA